MTERGDCDKPPACIFLPRGGAAKPAGKIAVWPRDLYMSWAGREGETAGTIPWLNRGLPSQ